MAGSAQAQSQTPVTRTIARLDKFRRALTCNQCPYPTTLSIIEFLRLAWREEAPPAREITVTGLDTLLASIPQDEQAQVTRFIRDTLQDVANLLANRRQTVQFVVQGKIDRERWFVLRTEVAPACEGSMRMGYLLDPQGCRVLADALGDTPETVISVHLLQRGLCCAYVAGDPLHFDGAIIQDNFCSAEPMGFGSDTEVLWELLKAVRGWECVNVASECAATLGEIIEGEMRVPVRYYGDIYHVLSKPALDFPNEAVRQLTLTDLELLESAPTEVRGGGFGSTRALLAEGVVACAIVSGRIVAIAHTSARTERHADIGAFTLEAWRGRGFATAAVAIVARRVQEVGQTPVWSAGEDNWASLRVAHKLGFTEVSRRTYVILDKSR